MLVSVVVDGAGWAVPLGGRRKCEHVSAGVGPGPPVGTSGTCERWFPRSPVDEGLARPSLTAASSPLLLDIPVLCGSGVPVGLVFIQSIPGNLPRAWYSAGYCGLHGEKMHEVSGSRRLVSPAGAHVTGTGRPGVPRACFQLALRKQMSRHSPLNVTVKNLPAI